METTGRLWAACHDYTAHSGSLSPGEGSRCYLNCGSDTQETMKASTFKELSMQNAFPCSHTALQVNPGKLLSWELTGGSSAGWGKCRGPIRAPQPRPKAELWPGILQSDVVCYQSEEMQYRCVQSCMQILFLREPEDKTGNKPQESEPPRPNLPILAGDCLWRHTTQSSVTMAQLIQFHQLIRKTDCITGHYLL